MMIQMFSVNIDNRKRFGRGRGPPSTGFGRGSNKCPRIMEKLGTLWRSIIEIIGILPVIALKNKHLFIMLWAI